MFDLSHISTSLCSQVCYLVLVSLVFRSRVFLYVPYEVDITFDRTRRTPGYSCLRTAVRCVTWVHGRTWPTPERFDTVVIALGREGLSSGRRYWEVQVGEKDDWYIGVVRASVNRKGRISVSTPHGYWALAMKKGQEYRVLPLHPPALHRAQAEESGRLCGLRRRTGVVLRRTKQKTHLHLYGLVQRETLPVFYLYCWQGLRRHDVMSCAGDVSY